NRQRRTITLPVMRAAASDARNAITPATSAGLATWTWVRLPATNSRTGSVTQPVSVTGGRAPLAGGPTAGGCRRGGHLWVTLGGPVRHLRGEAEVPARGEADDPAPGRAAFGVPPGELRDQQRRGHRVHLELLGPRLRGHRLEVAAQPVQRRRRERVGDPAGGV